MPENFGHNFDYDEGKNKLVSKQEVSEVQALLKGENMHNKLQQIRKLEENDNKFEEVLSSLYNGLGLDEVLENNDDIHKFVKGVVDGLIVENIELVAELIESGIEEFLDMLKSLLDPEVIWEIIKSIAEDLGDILDTFNEPYEGGLAIGGLGLGVVGKSFKGIKMVGKIKDRETSDNNNKEMNREASNKPDNVANLGGTLLENPRFNFLQSSEYRELAELYGGKIDKERLLGEGQNAIILEHPLKKGRVLKVAKQGAKDNISKEFNNHQTFYDTLEQGRDDFEGQLSDSIRIPTIKRGKGDNPVFFEMEKVEGQSFKSLFYREKYAEQLEKSYTRSELKVMNDSKLEEAVKELGLDPIPSIIADGDGGFSRALFKESQTFMWNRIRNPINKAETELGNTLSFLDWKGLRHTDMHAGNFMLSRDGKTTYIIDFGNTNLNH